MCRYSSRAAYGHVVLCCVFGIGASIFAQSVGAQSARVQRIITEAMDSKPQTAAGAKLYAQHCASCHGATAQGNPQTVTPVLAGQVVSYLVKQLADMGDADRDVPEMHRLMARPELGAPQSLRDMATYLSTLPPLATPEIGGGQKLLVGGRIYKTVCRDCHGNRGEGEFRRMVPALRGQHFSYLLMQARQLALGHRYSVDLEVIGLLEALTLDELSAVSDYASRLRPTSTSDEIAMAYGVALRR